MLEKPRGQFLKRSPAILVAGGILVVAVVAGTVLLLTKGDSKAYAGIEPVAARIDQVDGSVGIARLKADDQQLDWAEATVNMPVSVGDRIYSRDSAKAAIALTGRNYVRLNPDTTLDMLTLTEHRTQLALRSGSGLFDVGALSGDDFFEVATPCGAVDFREPGLYQIGMDGDNAIVSVLSGAAQVVGLGGSGYISKGEVYTLSGQDDAEVASATLAPDVAGDIVDGYYRERYPRTYDGRYRSYDTYLADPYFYDPYRTSVSYHYLPVDVPGLYDLDYYGDWADLSGYGHCWAPRVSTGWAPFRNGYWDLDDLWGPSWVSSEPWGWAPYHYGRWAFVSQRWYWVPAEVRTHPVYCPATVAFIPFQDQIAWVPLGPGEVYVSRYYDDGLRPRFLASREVINVVSARNTFVNFNAPGGVTIVPVRSLTRVIDPSALSTVDLRAVREARSVLDPFSVSGVREIALRREDARRRLKLGRIDNEVVSRPVVTSNAPETLRGRSDIAKALRVESVPENQRKNKLKVEKTGVVNSIRADGLPRPTVAGSQQRMNELASRAEQGDRSARRELRQMMREEQRSGAQPRAGQTREQTPAAGQQPDLSRKEMRLQRRAEQQQQQSQQEQMRQQRRMAQQQQSQQEQTRQQRKVERQQAAQQDAARRAQQQQMRQQRRVERQQRPPQPQQPQTREQRKEQKRKPPEAAAQQQQLRQQQTSRQAQAAGWQRDQIRAQRRAEQQRQASMMQQQQAARAQASQRQQRQAVQAQREAMMQQQAARARESQRQSAIQQQGARMQAAQREAMMQQQAARARESQRQAVIQQQAARAQGAQRAPRTMQQQFPSPQQAQQSREQRKAQRKPPQ